MSESAADRAPGGNNEGAASTSTAATTTTIEASVFASAFTATEATGDHFAVHVRAQGG
jgi:hypothetical protein